MDTRQSSFAAGELAPTLWGRSDFAKYLSGAKLLKNWIVNQHGALLNRPGFVRAAATKAATGAARLVPFRFSDGGNYVLEFGASYIRFYANGAQVLSGGSPCEVTTTYAAADIFRLKFDQSGDIITITNRGYEPMELRHTSGSATAWSFNTVESYSNKSPAFRPWRSDVTYAKDEVVLIALSPEAIVTRWVYYVSQQAANLNHAYNDAAWWLPLDAWWQAYDKTMLLPPPDLTFVKSDAAPTVVIGDLVAPQVTSDATRMPKEWQYVVTSVNPRGLESRPSLVLEPMATVAGNTDRKCQCYTDVPVVILWPKVGGAVEYRVYKGRSGIFGFIGASSPDPTSPLGGGVYRDDGTPPDFGTTPPTVGYPFKVYTWKSYTQYAVGDLVSNGGNVYRCILDGHSGASGPSGTGTNIVDGTDTAWDGTNTYAIGDRVASFGNTYECIKIHTTSAVVNGMIGPYGVGAYGLAASHGQFYPHTGAGEIVWKFMGQGAAVRWEFLATVANYVPPYPDCSTYYNQRHIFAVRSEIVGSAVGDYYNFIASAPLTEDSALGHLLSSSRWEEIRSMLATRTLLALTNLTEWAITGAQGGPLTAMSIQALPQSRRGSSWVDPLLIGAAALDIQERGNVVREILFDLYTDSYKSTEVSLLARHLFDGHTIVDWAYAENPYSLIWAVRDDGILLCCTYVREQEMVAWTQADTQGTFESVATIIENGEDAVYAIVKRGTTRNVERMASRVISKTNMSTWRFLDASMQVTGTALTSVSGLTWLEGMSVMILADGQVLGPYSVVPGVGIVDFSADMPDGASVVEVGLAYNSDGELLTPRDPRSDIRSNKKNVYRIAFEYVDSRGFAVGSDFSSLITWPQRSVADAFGVMPLETGFEHIRIPSTFDHEGPTVFRHSDPLPFTLLSIGREISVGG